MTARGSSSNVQTLLDKGFVMPLLYSIKIINPPKMRYEFLRVFSDLLIALLVLLKKYLLANIFTE